MDHTTPPPQEGHQPTFSLVPAEPTDIPRLAHIHVVACLPDNAFKLYFPTPQEFEARVTEMLHGQIGEPGWSHIKAVDEETGVLAGWASWHTPSDSQIRERDEKAAKPTAKIDIAGSGSKENKGPGKGEFDFPAGLATHVHEDSDKWLQRVTRGRRHMLCMAMFTEPFYQRCGIGTAMVQYGNKLADQAGLPIFLWASAFGYPIYIKRDFELMSHLDVDLRKWAPRAEGNDKGYGNYRFRYMLRLPRTLSDTSPSP